MDQSPWQELFGTTKKVSETEKETLEDLALLMRKREHEIQALKEIMARHERSGSRKGIGETCTLRGVAKRYFREVHRWEFGVEKLREKFLLHV
jgi:hypothetical protein